MNKSTIYLANHLERDLDTRVSTSNLGEYDNWCWCLILCSLFIPYMEKKSASHKLYQEKGEAARLNYVQCMWI
jgi:hypothetical protein